jgi:hypothetical protein
MFSAAISILHIQICDIDDLILIFTFICPSCGILPQASNFINFILNGIDLLIYFVFNVPNMIFIKDFDQVGVDRFKH